MKTLANIDLDFNGEDTSYLTHSFHPYPAKFPPQLPKRILSEFSRHGQSVLDPFCGSGTTLVEARLQGIDSVGVDINGLACLLSKAKATPLSEKQLKIADRVFRHIADESFYWQLGQRKPVALPDFEGLSHWFQPKVAEELTFIKEAIWKVEDADVKDFLKTVFASIIVRVSNQESDTRFAAIQKHIPDCFTFKLFLERGREFCKRIMDFTNKLNGSQASMEVFNADSRRLDFLRADSFDLIITSPPYANSYDYYLYHKFRKRWLELDVQFAQYNEIGSRREFSSLKKEPQKWVEDLQQCFVEMCCVLKANGLAFVVIGDSVIQKRLLKMDEVIAGFASQVGFKICDVLSSDLAKHSKIFNPAFTQRGKKEHLILLEKGHG